MLIGLATSLWLWRAALRWELVRHEPWLLLLLHAGDLAAVLLCVQWVRAGLRSPRSVALGDHAAKSYAVLPFAALCFAWVFSLAAERFAIAYEDAAFNRSRLVLGMAERGEPWGPWIYHGYTVYCSYADATGRAHQERIRVSTLGYWDKSVWPTSLGSGEIDGSTRFPTPIAIRYDLRWPNRCWQAMGEPAQSEDLIWWSQIPTASTLLAIIFSMALPYDLRRIVPLAVQIAFWIGFGFASPWMRLS